MDNHNALFQRTLSKTLSTSLPQDTTSLQWKNLNKHIDLQSPKGSKQILFNVSGSVKRGEMVALMGPSGSGKTTLLNIFGGRGLANLQGEVLIDGQRFKKSMKKSIAYVLQDDIFFNNLTVREQLYYTAVLRLPECSTSAPTTTSAPDTTESSSATVIRSRHESDNFLSQLGCNFNHQTSIHSANYQNKMKEVDAILRLLRMEKCADTPIMLVSGGERKRCNIGTELLTSPKILLLDEPTSGLDSTAANSLIATLRQLATYGLTIVTSIHQPSSKIFYSFDQLLLLADGHTVYSGDPKLCLHYFAGLNYHPPADYNPADFVMDLLTSSSTTVATSDLTPHVSHTPIQEVINTENGNNSPSSKRLLSSNRDLQAIQPIMNSNSAETKTDITNKSNLTEIDIEDQQSSSNISNRDTSPQLSSPDTVTVNFGTQPVYSSNGLSSGDTITPTTSEFSIRDHLIKAWSTKHFYEQSQQLAVQNNEAATPVYNKTISNTLSNQISRRSSQNWLLSRKSCKSNLPEQNDQEIDVTDTIQNKYPTRYSTQFFVLLDRTFKVSRSEHMTAIHWIETGGITIICGLIWFQMPYTEDQVTNRAGYIFFFQSYWFIMTLFQGMMQFLPERVILLKERSAGSYHLSAYFLAKTIASLPIRLSQPFIFLAVSYPMTNLNPSVSVFFSVTFTQLLATLCGESVGIFIGTLTTDFQKSLTFATLTSMFLMLTGGFYASKLPFFIKWARFISPFKYSYDACIELVFDQPVPCSGGNFLTACVDNPDGTASTSSVISSLGSTESVGLNVSLLIIFMIFFRIAGYLSLRYIPINNGRK